MDETLFILYLNMNLNDNVDLYEVDELEDLLFMMIILHGSEILNFRLLLIFGVIIGILSKMGVSLLLIHKVVLLASSNLLKCYAQYEESSRVPYTKLNHNKNKFYLD